jgi:solute carrier family 35
MASGGAPLRRTPGSREKLLPVPSGSEPVTPPVSLARSVGLCALYGCTSVSITFFNKAVFSVYAFNYPCTVTLLQIVVCLFFLRAAHAAKRITLPAVTKEMARVVYPLTLCWWTYVVSGLIALRYLNVPMFSTLRKFTALLVLVGERVVLKRTAPTPVWAAISVMVSGGVLAGFTDLTMSIPGYVFVAICCFATAMYLILIVRVGAASGLDTFGLLYYNNVLSVPLMLGYLVFCTTELQGVVSYPRLGELQFWAFLLVSASQATLLNIAIFMCTKVNSPLATTVTGQAKDLVTVSVGLFLFGDVKITVPNLCGLALALIGSMLYSYVKYRASVMARKMVNKNKTNDIKG